MIISVGTLRARSGMAQVHLLPKLEIGEAPYISFIYITRDSPGPGQPHVTPDGVVYHMYM